jgi:hypothetical protein
MHAQSDLVQPNGQDGGVPVVSHWCAHCCTCKTHAVHLWMARPPPQSLIAASSSSAVCAVRFGTPRRGVDDMLQVKSRCK